MLLIFWASWSDGKFRASLYIYALNKQTLQMCSHMISIHMPEASEGTVDSTIKFKHSLSATAGDKVAHWRRQQFQQIVLLFSTFSQYSGLILKNYSNRLIFHLTFPFIFSQSPIFSLQSPIERGDIASSFPYRKGGKSICWSTFFIYVEN